MQAIKTRYRGPTNHRGSRIIASAQAGRLTVPWDYEHDVEENHRLAAIALCEKFAWAWGPRWATGTLASGEFVHVFQWRYP